MISLKGNAVQQKQNFRLRFAPSPNGRLHLGHAYSALLNQYIAQALDGEFIIRMEDIDQLRCTKAFIDASIDDLLMLGITSDIDILYQSKRQPAYELAIEALKILGVLYPCLATRKDIKNFYADRPKKYDPDGGLIYPDLYKNLNDDEKQEIYGGNNAYALRLDMKKAVEIIGKNGKKLVYKQVNLANGNVEKVAFDATIWGDVVIKRKDIGTSYHLSVVVDDDFQKIGHVVRGADLLAATYIHSILQMLLSIKQPTYFHHQLIKDEANDKLSKGNKSKAFSLLADIDGDVSLITDLLDVVTMRRLSVTLSKIYTLL